MSEEPAPYDTGRSSTLIEQMRRHVASYKTLSNHRQACLDMCDRIEKLERALDKLARLGNEPHFGNSTGNTIARQALADYKKT